MAKTIDQLCCIYNKLLELKNDTALNLLFTYLSKKNFKFSKEECWLAYDIIVAQQNGYITLQIYIEYVTKKYKGSQLRIRTVIKFYETDPIDAVIFNATKLLKSF